MSLIIDQILKLKSLVYVVSTVFCLVQLQSPAALAAGEAYLSSGIANISSGSTRYDVSPGYAHTILPWLSVGGELGYTKTTYQDNSVSSMLVLGGPTANFGPTPADAFFVSLGVAYRSGSGSPTSTVVSEDPGGVGFYLMTGKRFPLIGGISFRPSLGVVATGSTGIIVRPLAISYAL
jgi:hypothetical protein